MTPFFSSDVLPVFSQIEGWFSALGRPTRRKLERKKTRRNDAQIALALEQAETGTPVAEVIRRMGISEQVFHRWKKVYWRA